MTNRPACSPVIRAADRARALAKATHDHELAMAWQASHAQERIHRP
jgi:hypothetical protein